MRKILFVLITLSILSFVCADGMIFNPEFEIHPTEETTQVAIIDITDTGYNLDLLVTIYPGDWPNEYIYWAVPLEELPEDIILVDASASGFEHKVSEYNSNMRTAEDEEWLRDNFGTFFASGMAVSNPVALPVIVGGFVLFGVMSSVSMGASEDGLKSIASYDFGDLGSAEVYETDSQYTLQEVFYRAGATPSTNLAPYLNKKVVLFKLKKKDSMGLVATFEFTQNERIYFPSGTTQFFDHAPQKFAVMISAPKAFIYEEASGIKTAETHVGLYRQYLFFTKDGKKQNYYDYYYPGEGPQELPGAYEIYKTDLVLEKKGFRMISIKDLLSSIMHPIFLGFLVGLLVAIGAITYFLKSIKKFNLVTFGKFLLFYILLSLVAILAAGILSIALFILFMVVQVVSNPYMASNGMYMLMSLAFILIGGLSALAIPIIGTVAFFFFKKGKELKKWAGFTRMQVLKVAVVIVAIEIVLGLIGFILP